MTWLTRYHPSYMFLRDETEGGLEDTCSYLEAVDNAVHDFHIMHLMRG